MECACVIELHDLNGRSTRHWLAIGQVVGVHISRSFLRDGLFDTGAAHPIMRAGYRDEYVEATPETMFRMMRPGT